jgi:hypothetical protein
MQPVESDRDWLFVFILLAWPADTVPICAAKVIIVLLSYCQHILTPWSTVLLEKLTGLQLVKRVPSFYGT